MSVPAQTGQMSEDSATLLDARLARSNFDPTDFLNDALPPLVLSQQTQGQKASRSTQIQTVSTDILAIMSSLNSHNIRTSSELTTLTDEIIRSGNRLAYEVEVLRGDVNGLHELLSESLRHDISLFVGTQLSTEIPVRTTEDSPGEQGKAEGAPSSIDDPDFMVQLRMLGKVKARLEAVISLFGEAMNWPMPPSDMSSSLISVSAPELGIQNTEQDDKAREALRNIRTEIAELLNTGSGPLAGLESASKRVDEYRQLSLLWKGTSEEKARTKFVDTLTRIVEDRRRALDAQRASRDAKSDVSQRSSSAMGRLSKASGDVGGAAGLFRNLQRLKDDLYLE